MVKASEPSDYKPKHPTKEQWDTMVDRLAPLLFRMAAVSESKCHKLCPHKKDCEIGRAMMHAMVMVARAILYDDIEDLEKLANNIGNRNYLNKHDN